MSGFCLIIPFIAVPPAEENEAIVGGSTPKTGVLSYFTAPTVIAPVEFDCPTIVENPQKLPFEFFSFPLNSPFAY